MDWPPSLGSQSASQPHPAPLPRGLMHHRCLVRRPLAQGPSPPVASSAGIGLVRSLALRLCARVLNLDMVDELDVRKATRKLVAETSLPKGTLDLCGESCGERTLWWPLSLRSSLVQPSQDKSSRVESIMVSRQSGGADGFVGWTPIHARGAEHPRRYRSLQA